ncbi:MAG: TonB-dependent receptor, partial [Cyanobacteria bacterium REEB65]|nr:TonB-dependent receptor [Cyanobacteria bacterium REEB65]
ADDIGDLLYRGGVASSVDHHDVTGGLQADSAWKLGPSHTLRYGLFASDDDATVTQNALVYYPNSAGQFADVNGIPTTTPTAIDPQPTKLAAQLYGLYAQDEWKLAEPLTLHYGLRFDQMLGMLDTNELEPRVGLVYDATKATTLHAGYSRYFTPPSAELITPKTWSQFQGTTNAIFNPGAPATSPGSVAGPYANPLPERDNYYDVGVSQQLLEGWTAGLDGYYKDATDVQDEGQFNNQPVYSTFNYAIGHVYGAELSTSFRNDKLSTYLNLADSTALAKGVVTEQYNFAAADLQYIASHFVHMDHDQGLTASMGFMYQLAGWGLGFDALYGSGMRTNATAQDGSNIPNGGELPPYFQLNF